MRWLPSTPHRAAVAVVLLLALMAIAIAVWQLERATHGVTIGTQRLGSTPVTLFSPATPGRPAPVVLVAHGFAGSQQLMQPLALTLAHNGFRVLTFDFPGHGRNTAPMFGGLADPDRSLRTLLASMDEMGALALRLARADGGLPRYAVLGHSMASDIVVRHAQAHPEVRATVGVSLFAPSITAATPPNQPRNLLVIAGAWEPQMMATEALRVTGPGAALDRTYGSMADGSARRATLSPGVEHIAVLYSAHTQGQALAWLNAAFGRPPAVAPFVASYGLWLGLLLAGVLALGWPLARLLPGVGPPRSSPLPRSRWWAWRGQAPLTLLPALLTPLLLWPLPSDWLPLLLGDYLVLHFALYGAITIAGLCWLGERPPGIARGRRTAWLLAVVAVTLYAVLVVGLPVDRYVFNMRPEAVRLPLVAVLCIGTLPYFLADEWLTRRAGAARGAYVVSKLCFLLSLVVAIALNPQRLFFLALIVPAILLLFIVYGLFSRWVGRRTGHPAVAAVANALAFGSFIAVTFPLVS